MHQLVVDYLLVCDSAALRISELNSLGFNTETKNEELRDVQALDNLTDEVKQNFIHEYKTRYSEE